MPASACLMNPMICSVVKRLFFMSVLLGDGLYSFTWYGSVGAGQIGALVERLVADGHVRLDWARELLAELRIGLG